VFLNSATPEGEVRGIHFNYFKDTRPQGGSLKHGHGPGGAPVVSKDELLSLIVDLSQHGVITAEDVEDVAQRIRDRQESAA
jgi:microsomal dipeptidase-like Zn-dependent dipeptidase